MSDDSAVTAGQYLENFVVEVEKGIIMRSFGFAAVSGCLCFAALGAIAGTLDDPAASAVQLEISGKLEFETAEMLKARTSKGNNPNPMVTQTVDHIWFGHTIGTLNIKSNPSKNLSIHTSFEFRQYMTMIPLSRDIPRDPYFGNTYWTSFYIREGQGVYSFIKNESMSLDMAFGYMPYKYNDEVRNLGEFLFRSGTYPLFLLGSFDRPFARLTGLRTSLDFGDDNLRFKFDVLGLMEREIRPINDLSLAVIAKVKAMKMVELGAGIDFARCVPMDIRMDEPETDKNRYLVYNKDSTRIDTGYYSFRGTKMMAHATIDPFGMVRNQESLLNEIVGKNGGKIYGEYAIIGLKNYPSDLGNNPIGYKKIGERSPWMVGVNLPFWKILDVCAFELERFPSPNPDNYYATVINGLPVPNARNNGQQYDSSTYQPRWNWSLYMRKQMVKNFSVVCQMGRDHQRWEMHPSQAIFYDFEAAMVKPDEWGWHVMGVFTF